jgi:CHAT domain
MARRVRVLEEQQQSSVETSGCLNALLIIGAVGEIAKIRNETTGVESTVSFQRLRRIEQFLAALTEFSKPRPGQRSIRVEKLSGDVAKGGDFEEALREKLAKNRYDTIHYYGHSVTIDQDTFLIVPGELEYTGHQLSVRALAHWLKQVEAGKKPSLVIFTSCEGGSVRSAVEMMNAGVQSVLGFRWEVEEELAVKYIREFLNAYLLSGNSMPEAFRTACDEVRAGHQGTPAWASAILVTD